MKNLKLMTLTVLMAFGIVQISQAQKHMRDKDERYEMHHRENNRPEIPNLTEEQKTKIKELKLSFHESVKPLENQLNEKRAKLKTMTDEVPADRNKIESLVSEMGELKTQIDIVGVNHRLDVKDILTDEQQMFLENNRRKHKRH